MERTTSEIHVNHATGQCRITVRPSGRVYVSTAPAVGLALIGESSRFGHSLETMQWVDMLATHGVAVGLHHRKVITAAVIPAKVRTIQFTDGADTPSTTITCTFPACFLAMQVNNGGFVRATIMLVDVTRQAQLSIISHVPLLVPFPYGNVYDTGTICWGAADHADIHTLLDLETRFFGSGFNTDLRRRSGGVLAAGVLPAPPTAAFIKTPADVLQWVGSDGA